MNSMYSACMSRLTPHLVTRDPAAAAAWYDEAEAEAENDLGMAAKWGPDWPDRLYHGFDDVPRAGLVQLRLAQ